MLFSVVFLTLLCSAIALPARPTIVERIQRDLVVSTNAAGRYGVKTIALSQHEFSDFPDEEFNIFVMKPLRKARVVVPVSKTQLPGSILWQDLLAKIDPLKSKLEGLPDLDNLYVHVGKLYTIADDVMLRRFKFPPISSSMADIVKILAIEVNPKRGQVIIGIFPGTGGRTLEAKFTKPETPYLMIVLEYLPDLNRYHGIPFVPLRKIPFDWPKSNPLETYIDEKNIVQDLKQYTGFVSAFHQRLFIEFSDSAHRVTNDDGSPLRVSEENLIQLELEAKDKMPECTPENTNLSEGIKSRFSEFLAKYCKEKNKHSTKQPRPEQGSSGDSGPSTESGPPPKRKRVKKEMGPGLSGTTVKETEGGKGKGPELNSLLLLASVASRASKSAIEH